MPSYVGVTIFGSQLAPPHANKEHFAGEALRLIRDVECDPSTSRRLRALREDAIELMWVVTGPQQGCAIGSMQDGAGCNACAALALRRTA